MELPLTVTDSTGRSRRDVLVRCDPTLAVQDLAVAVLSGNGQSSQTLSSPVYLADRPIAPDASVGRAGIGPGGILSFGGPVASATRRPEGRYQLAVVGGMAAGMVVALPEATITVGRSERCDVSLDDVEVSRLHVSLTRAGDTVTIDDMHSANGTMVNGVAIQAPTVIRPNDLVAIGNSILTLRVPQDRAAECEPVGDGRLRFNKPPRQRQATTPVTIQLPEEPKRPTGRHFSWLAMVSPLLLGLVFVAVTRQPTFLLFSLASPLMLGANALSDRRSGRRTFETRLAEYEKAKASLAENIATAVRREEKDRRDAAPDPATVADIAAPTQQLWERRREDADFLRVRVGLADLPSDIKLVAGRDTPPVDQPVAHCVPVTVSLPGAGVVGVAGPRSSSVRLMRSVVLQLATLHSPLDLSVVFLSPSSPDGWDWLKWLPHLVPTPAQSGARLVGIAPEQRRARIDELVALVEARVGEQTRRYDRQPGMWPTTIVLLDDVTTLRAEPGVAYLLREGPAVGIVALCLSADRSGLPAEAQVSIEFQPTSAGSEVLKLTVDDTTIENILPDGVDETHAAGVARSLAPLFEVAARTAGAAGLPPPPVSHLDLIGMPSPTADSVLARWESVPAGRHSPAVVGLLEDGPFTVDLRHDGPHLLIAGTTGAGKSELLQTLVASLAVSNRPDDLTFLLVDFKGGSAFKDCDRLPHTLGVISNLDGRLVERALDSIQAELRWRQAMFSKAGAKDYDEYAGGAGRQGPRIPRLAVVIDELKELSDAYSDAVTRLNQAARLGRSLGVHLVLATQKPALIPGLADLRANTDLRLCLRVQDDADSRDVVGVPDAAAIRRVDVGRGIARQSDGSQVNFQTGYLGSPLPSAGSPSHQRVEVLPFDLTTIGAAGAVGLRPPGVGGSAEGPIATSLQVLVEAIRAGADQFGAPAGSDAVVAAVASHDHPRRLAGAGSRLGIGAADRPDRHARRAAPGVIAAGLRRPQPRPGGGSGAKRADDVSADARRVGCQIRPPDGRPPVLLGVSPGLVG